VIRGHHTDAVAANRSARKISCRYLPEGFFNGPAGCPNVVQPEHKNRQRSLLKAGNA